MRLRSVPLGRQRGAFALLWKHDSAGKFEHFIALRGLCLSLLLPGIGLFGSFFEIDFFDDFRVVFGAVDHFLSNYVTFRSNYC